MRALYITHATVPGTDAASRRVAALTAGLAQAGLEVTVLAPGRGSLDGVRRLEIPRLARGAVAIEVAMAARVVAAARRRGPQVAVVHFGPATSAVVTALHAAKVPYVLDQDRPFLDEIERSGRGPGVLQTVQGIARQVAADARAIVVPDSPTRVHVARQLGVSDAIVVPPGVEPFDPPLEERDEARRRLGMPPDVRVAAVIDSLAPGLRLDLLSQGHRHVPGLTLLFDGDGPQASFIQAMSVAARPSSPVLLASDAPRRDVLSVANFVVCMAPFCFLSAAASCLAGRRVVLLDRAAHERLAAAFEGWTPSVLAVPTIDGLRDALEAVQVLEAREGPLPTDGGARNRLGWGAMAQELAALMSNVLDGSAPRVG